MNLQFKRQSLNGNFRQECIKFTINNWQKFAPNLFGWYYSRHASLITSMAPI
jgi:hypothetical protein